MAAAPACSLERDDPSVVTVKAALAEGRRRLAGVAAPPGFEASLLLAAAVHQPRTWIAAHPDETLSPGEVQVYRASLAQVAGGQALPYVLGLWDFYGRTFGVTPAVLIPRPETELLIDHALEYAARTPGRLHGLDIGTGSGCIAVTLAAELRASRWCATDIDPRTLRVAHDNAVRHGVRDRIDLVQADLAAGVSDRFDLVCANLPYVPAERLASLDVARREPKVALDGGPQGLSLVLRLIANLTRLLAPGGRALLEIDHTHVETALRAAFRQDPQSDCAVFPDLAGQARLLQVDRRT